MASFAIRLGLACALGAATTARQSAHHEHESIAKNLALGDGFRFNFFGADIDRPNLTSQQAPFVPGLLAGCYLTFGVETPSAFTAMILLQILASSATVILIAQFAESAIKRGKATGLFVSIFPSFVISGLHIQALVWNLFWLAALLRAFQIVRDQNGIAGFIWFSAAAVGAMHTDPILGAVVVVLLAYRVYETGVRFSSLRNAMGICLLIVAGMTPWTIRNYAVHGRLMLVKDSFWYVLWQGNNRISQGTDKLLLDESLARKLSQSWNPSAAQGNATEIRNTCISVNDALSAQNIHELFALPTECQRMDWFRNRLMFELRSDPMHYVQLCGKRLLSWIWFDTTNPRSFLPIYRTTYLALLGLAIAGGIGLRHRRRELMPAVLAGAMLTLVHALIITSARFRIPFELLIAIPAAASLQAMAAALAQAKWLNAWKWTKRHGAQLEAAIAE